MIRSSLPNALRSHYLRTLLTMLMLLIVAAAHAPADASFPKTIGANGGGPAAANPNYHAGFPVALNGAIVGSSSVALGDLTGDGIPEIVVGANDGKVYAYRGNGTKLWEY